MKYKYLSILLVIFMCFISSCKPDIDLTLDYDCTFEQIDENMEGVYDEIEQEMFNQCFDEALTSIADIEINLIGEWELIGYGDGWQTTVSHPCAYVKFTSDEFVFSFDNGTINHLMSGDWKIEEDLNSGTFFLVVEPEVQEYLSMYCFTENLMAGNEEDLGFSVYIYEKVR